MEIKHYEINGRTYSFDIVESCNTLKGIVFLGICKENGRGAWLDPYGVQFMGDARVTAREVKASSLPYGYTIWGGEIRDALPHGRRYYMNGRRW